MDRVVQEFYCNECDGYFRVALNMALNINVRVKCPECGHLHDRNVKNGVLFDGHVQVNKFMDELCPVQSAYSKDPLHKRSVKHMRVGMVIEDHTRDIIEERWREIYGDRIL